MEDRKLRICLVTNQFPGLTETFITTKALELSRKGHKVTVIQNQQNKHVNTSHLRLVREAGIEVLAAPAHTGRQVLKSLLHHPAIVFSSFSFSFKSFSKKIQQQVRSQLVNAHAFDIIHVEFSGLAIEYQTALETTKTKTVVSCRGTAEKVKPLSDPLRAEQLKKLFGSVHAIHCVSADMAATVQLYVSQPKKIFVNRPSVDTEIFKRHKPYEVKNTMLRILSIGRFTFQKGYIIGLMAAKKLQQQNVSFHWTIVGDGPGREEMLFHIHTLGLQNTITLAGKKNRDEIIELYNNTDVFMLSSVYEGIANVCLEAMSMELPVIATKSGGMEEVIAHGTDGLLCNIYDVDDLANAVAGISMHGEERKLMGINAREKIINEYTIQRQANVFEEKYLQLITT